MDLRPVGKEERKLGQWDFFFLWAGAAISIMEIFSGAMLAPLGLLVGVAVIIAGHVIGNSLLALSCLHGQEMGITSMLSVRFSFGVRGSHFFAFLNIIQLVGWMAVMQIVAADAMNAVTSFSSRSFWIVVIGIITTLWAMGGQKVWKVLNSVSTVLLVLLTVVMTYQVFVSFPPVNVPQDPMPLGLAMDIVIAMPISWLPLASDYSRYAKRGSMRGTWAGYFVFSSWMYFIGLISALGTGESFPTHTLMLMGLGVPAMIIVALSTITSDYMDVYSAAASWLNVREKSDSRVTMLVFGAAGIALSLVFPIEQYQNFLLFIGSLFCPLFAIVIVDYLTKGRDYDVEAALGKDGYWYTHGFSMKAMAAWALGLTVFWVSSHYAIGGSLPSMAASALLYMALDHLSTFPVSRNQR
jgi:putative hydroxymethylpyrimidine transporter CytX